MVLFRIGQEALTNVLKHAKAAMVRMTLAVDAAKRIPDDRR